LKLLILLLLRRHFFLFARHLLSIPSLLHI
jgi:hypothetical protein